MTTLLIATRNAHKVQEIAALLGAEFVCRALLQEFPDAPVPVEDADSFAGNAAKKAASLATWLRARGCAADGRTFVLADDSGLEVDALGGAPGIHSARFAALDTGAPGNSPDADNNAKLLRLLANVLREQRTARFRCVLALVELNAAGPLPEAQIFSGTCEGSIDFTARGAGGFGYDPLFIPRGHTASFAELGEAVKNGLSHRAQALAGLRVWFSRAASAPQVSPTRSGT